MTGKSERSIVIGVGFVVDIVKVDGIFADGVHVAGDNVGLMLLRLGRDGLRVHNGIFIGRVNFDLNLITLCQINPTLTGNIGRLFLIIKDLMHWGMLVMGFQLGWGVRIQVALNCLNSTIEKVNFRCNQLNTVVAQNLL